MRLLIRQIGNSLGVIIPRSVLREWGLGEGDALELTNRGIKPPSGGAGHAALDELKRKLAILVVSRFPANHIRAHSLANLHRWERQGAWVPAYDQWRAILESGNDGALYCAMLGRDDRSNQLRQSPPYVGLLPREDVEKLNEEAAA